MQTKPMGNPSDEELDWALRAVFEMLNLPKHLTNNSKSQKADLAIIFKSPLRHYDRSGLRLFQIK